MTRTDQDVTVRLGTSRSEDDNPEENRMELGYYGTTPDDNQAQVRLLEEVRENRVIIELHQWKEGKDYKGTPYSGWEPVGITVRGYIEPHSADRHVVVSVNCSSHQENNNQEMELYLERYQMACLLCDEVRNYLLIQSGLGEGPLEVEVPRRKAEGYNPVG